MSMMGLLAACESATGAEAGAAAQSRALDETVEPLIEKLSVRTLEDDVVAIFMDDFSEKIRNREYAALYGESRIAQLHYAAQANYADALGVTGDLQADVVLDGRRVLVVFNALEIDKGRFQATSFSVLNGSLGGKVERALTNVKLHFANGQSKMCDRPFRGCAIVPSASPHAFSNWQNGGIGLPEDVRIDAESPSLPVNALGKSTELWMLPNPDVAKAIWPEGTLPVHRLACVEPLTEVAASECSPDEGADELPVGVEASVPGARVFIVDEGTYQRALANGALRAESSLEYADSARRFVTAFNTSAGAAAGVLAKPVDAAYVDADWLIVLKHPKVDGDVVGGRSFFVVPGPLSLPVDKGFVGKSPSMVGFDWDAIPAGLCGLELFPEINPEPSPCPGPFFDDAPGYGTDRFAGGLPRATVRFPSEFQGGHYQRIFSCSVFEFPRKPPTLIGNEVVLKVEYCNGVDDDGDGVVDEGGICEVATCSQCQPISDCGGRACVSVPDGCGGSLSCPCP